MVLVFGGTTEGRKAIETLEDSGNTFYYSTKTGEQDVPLHHGVAVSGAMDATAMITFCHHEVPEDKRRQVFAEAVRVTKPGGKLIFVEFHKPHWYHPFRLYQRLVFLLFEPYATDLWRHELTHWFPEGHSCQVVQHKTYFGGLYQKLVVQKSS